MIKQTIAILPLFLIWMAINAGDSHIENNSAMIGLKDINSVLWPLLELQNSNQVVTSRISQSIALLSPNLVNVRDLNDALDFFAGGKLLADDKTVETEMKNEINKLSKELSVKLIAKDPNFINDFKQECIKLIGYAKRYANYQIYVQREQNAFDLKAPLIISTLTENIKDFFRKEKARKSLQSHEFDALISLMDDASSSYAEEEDQIYQTLAEQSEFITDPENDLNLLEVKLIAKIVAHPSILKDKLSEYMERVNVVTSASISAQTLAIEYSGNQDQGYNLDLLKLLMTDFSRLSTDALPFKNSELSDSETLNVLSEFYRGIIHHWLMSLKQKGRIDDIFPIIQDYYHNVVVTNTNNEVTALFDIVQEFSGDATYESLREEEYASLVTLQAIIIATTMANLPDDSSFRLKAKEDIVLNFDIYTRLTKVEYGWLRQVGPYFSSQPTINWSRDEKLGIFAVTSLLQFLSQTELKELDSLNFYRLFDESLQENFKDSDAEESTNIALIRLINFFKSHGKVPTLVIEIDNEQAQILKTKLLNEAFAGIQEDLAHLIKNIHIAVYNSVVAEYKAHINSDLDKKSQEYKEKSAEFKAKLKSEEKWTDGVLTTEEVAEEFTRMALEDGLYFSVPVQRRVI